MQWIVDKVPDQALLNTAGWRFIIPQLYKKYPNHDMNMNITLSGPPDIRISENNIGATVYADLIIDVLEEEEVIPVACISLVNLSCPKGPRTCLSASKVCLCWFARLFLSQL